MNLPLNDLVRKGDALLPADAQSLVRLALGLRAAAQAGPAQPLLQGKHVAIYGADSASVPGQEIAEAAAALGARVSRLPPDPQLLRGDLAAAASSVRLLARLYDAIAFDALSAEAAAGLQAALGLPVYGALPSFDNLLSAQPTPGAAPERMHLVQALLVLTLLR
jgi:hypothetical protein